MRETAHFLDITVTTACNFGCRYCSEGLSPDVPDKARLKNAATKVPLSQLYDFIGKFLTKYPKEEFNLSFWGGEPFMNWNYCRTVIDHYVDDDRLHFMFYTNGSYIKKYFDELLAIKRKIGDRLFIQVSYDGKMVNDVERLTKNGKSTAKIAKDAFLLLQKNGFNTTTKSTVTPRTFKHMFEVFKEFLEMGTSYFPTPDIVGEYPEGWEDDLKENLLNIAKYIYSHNIDLKLFKWFNTDRALCSLGEDYYAMDVDGAVVCCHGALYDSFDDHHLGHVSDENILEELEGVNQKYRDLRKKLECHDCKVLFCLKCPIHTYNLPSTVASIPKGLTKEEEYEYRYTKINENMCKVFKINNKVHVALRRALMKRKEQKKGKSNV